MLVWNDYIIFYNNIYFLYLIHIWWIIKDTAWIFICYNNTQYNHRFSSYKVQIIHLLLLIVQFTSYIIYYFLDEFYIIEPFPWLALKGEYIMFIVLICGVPNVHIKDL